MIGTVLVRVLGIATVVGLAGNVQASRLPRAAAALDIRPLDFFRATLSNCGREWTFAERIALSCNVDKPLEPPARLASRNRMSEPKSIPKVVYGFDPIFTGISTRFRTRHGININRHIESMSWVGQRIEQGFNFVPFSASDFLAELKEAGFENDLREKHLGFIPSVGAIAALATKGEGYREPGSPSLHCAVAPDLCNVHLDNVGFRVDGYNPDAGQHIVDELIWQDKVAPLLGTAIGKILPDSLSGIVTDMLHRLHPVVPNSRQVKPFSEVGVEFDVISRRSRDLQQHVRLTIDLTHACADTTCGAWRKLHGQTVQGDNRVMVMFKVLGM
jgi:hypothetical protein